MKNKMKDYLITLLGLVMLGLGLYFIKSVVEPEGIMRTLPYILVGVGCGVFGSGMGTIIQKRSIKNHPEIAKQMEIDKNDERNIAVSNAAKAKAYDMMVFVFGSLMLSFALMEVDLIATLLLVGTYLFVIFYGIYHRVQLEKKM